MKLPSLRVMKIATADPALFESLMARAGLRVARRNEDPLETRVQQEAIEALASVINEDVNGKVRLSPYHRQLRTLAEQAGYVVVVENCGPPGADPCHGDLGPEAMAAVGGPDEMQVDVVMPVDEVGEGEALEAGHSAEIEQLAAMPIGTELASAMMAVLQGKKTAGVGDEDPEEDLHGEMPMGEELPQEEAEAPFDREESEEVE